LSDDPVPALWLLCVHPEPKPMLAAGLNHGGELGRDGLGEQYFHTSSTTSSFAPGIRALTVQ
jgi:hypothetical protein